MQPGRSRTIELEDFVDLEEIDPIYYEKTNYLVPQADVGAEKPYALLLKAMDKAGKVGVGRFVLRTKQYLAAIRPSNGILALETMYFRDEIRTKADFDEVPVKARVTDHELDIALHLIEAQAVAFDPKRYSDTYRERVLKLVKDKAAGKEIVVEEEQEATTEVGSIMDALRASVEAARQGKRATAASGGKRSTKPRSSNAGGTGDLDSKSREELYEQAQELGIPRRSSMSKKELITALKKAS